MSTIVTRVSRADWGENQFMGHAVIRDLVGHETLASALALAVTGRRFTADEAAVIDDIALCTIAAEPRIWPLKLARICASYGSPLAGFAAGHLILEGALVGPWSTGLAATLLVALRAELPTDAWSQADVDAVIARRLAAGERFPGYGVAFRPADERVGALESCLARRNRSDLPFWRLMRAVERALCTHKRLPANVGAADGAALLDLAMSPTEIAMVVTACTSLSFIPNALEASELRSPELRSMPREQIRYVGREQRLSPRAQTKLLSDSNAPFLRQASYR